MASILVENPAGRRLGIQLLKNPASVNRLIHSNRALFQGRNGHQRFEGRTGSQVLLGYPVNKGQRQIFLKLVVIPGIHHIGQAVVVVAGISNGS